MTNQGVSFHMPPGGQFSAAVDRSGTATELQNVDAHAVTCVFTTPPPSFGTISPRFGGPQFHGSADDSDAPSDARPGAAE